MSTTPSAPPGAREKAALWFLPAGLAIGVAGALCGIGGGIFAAPLLHGARKVPLKRAAATAILVVVATTVPSTVTEAFRADSDLRLALALPIVSGGLVGVRFGFAAAKRISERALKSVFAVILFLAGLRILLFSSSLTVASVLGPAAAMTASLALGLAGGFLTPLLGIGGGIVIVPGVFLLLGQPFGVARAASLASGAVSALQSLWLHGRAGNVSWSLGVPLALGAGLGSLGGVVAAHDPFLAQVGRILLGSVLLVESARFVLALRRARDD